MTRRLLPREDYGRLVGTELEAIAPHLPADAEVLVIEDEQGAIVGCWSAFSLLHVEGVWVAPEHRGKTGVARNLLQGMRQIARRRGAQAVNTGSVSPDVSAMLRKLGAVALEGEQFSLRVV